MHFRIQQQHVFFIFSQNQIGGDKQPAATKQTKRCQAFLMSISVFWKSDNRTLHCFPSHEISRKISLSMHTLLVSSEPSPS